MTRLQALAEAADLLRRYRPWAPDDVKRLHAEERKRLAKSHRPLERSMVCSLGLMIHSPIGDLFRHEANGETWQEAVDSYRFRLRQDRIDYNGAAPWMHALLDCAADGTLDTNAARQFRAWIDRQEES